MGMIQFFFRLPLNKLNELLTEPEKIHNLRKEIRDNRKKYIEEGRLINIEKSWHGIHYLLNGNAWGGAGSYAGSIEGGTPPACWVIFGDKSIGDEDLGYGPAKYLLPDQVKKVDEFLNSITQEDLYNKFNPKLFNENKIYPRIWEREEENGTIGFLIEYFSVLVKFYKNVAMVNDCIVSFII